MSPKVQPSLRHVHRLRAPGLTATEDGGSRNTMLDNRVSSAARGVEIR